MKEFYFQGIILVMMIVSFALIFRKSKKQNDEKRVESFRIKITDINFDLKKEGYFVECLILDTNKKEIFFIGSLFDYVDMGEGKNFIFDIYHDKVMDIRWV